MKSFIKRLLFEPIMISFIVVITLVAGYMWLVSSWIKRA